MEPHDVFSGGLIVNDLGTFYHSGVGVDVIENFLLFFFGKVTVQSVEIGIGFKLVFAVHGLEHNALVGPVVQIFGSVQVNADRCILVALVLTVPVVGVAPLLNLAAMGLNYVAVIVQILLAVTIRTHNGIIGLIGLVILQASHFTGDIIGQSSDFLFNSQIAAVGQRTGGFHQCIQAAQFDFLFSVVGSQVFVCQRNCFSQCSLGFLTIPLVAVEKLNFSGACILVVLAVVVALGSGGFQLDIPSGNSRERGGFQRFIRGPGTLCHLGEIGTVTADQHFVSGVSTVGVMILTGQIGNSGNVAHFLTQIKGNPQAVLHSRIIAIPGRVPHGGRIAVISILRQIAGRMAGGRGAGDGQFAVIYNFLYNQVTEHGVRFPIAVIHALGCKIQFSVCDRGDKCVFRQNAICTAHLAGSLSLQFNGYRAVIPPLGNIHTDGHLYFFHILRQLEIIPDTGVFLLGNPSVRQIPGSCCHSGGIFAGSTQL